MTDWLAVSAIVPFRVFHTSIRYLDPSGQRVQIVNPFIHHHNETLAGPADPWVLARGALRVHGVTLGARLGATLPLGRTVEDPFALGDRGLAHEHTQLGTGTFAPVVGVDASRALGGVHLDAFALTVQSLYTSGEGYRAGDRYAGGLGAAASLGAARWRFRATAEVQHETAETWHGIVRTDEGNTGRTDVLAGVEATLRVNDRWQVAASVKLPVYTHVQGGQLEVPLFVGLAVRAQLHLRDADEHHHGHAEPPPGDWTGLDKADASTDGSAVPLVPVPGKITVFDFWATWCEPCSVVDHELAELARRYPDDLAVRKINIVDADSPASRTHLGAATIPHLKVFGRDGALLWARSAPPLDLARAVEQLVTSPPSGR